MTSTLKFQILRDDSTYSLGSLLLRMLSPKETNDTNALMSLLRLMSLNPQLVLEKGFPRWKDTRTFKLSVVFAKQGVFAELFKACRTYLEERRNEKRLINSIGIEVETRTPLIAGPLPQQVYFERCWISTTSASQILTDCSKRYLNQSIDTLDDIKAFTTMPLLPIGLSKFLQHQSRSERGLPQVASQLPVDLSAHKAYGSHVAQSMMSRLTKDIKYYADKENERFEPFLKGMTENEIHTMVHHQTNGTNTLLDAAITQIRQILSSLSELQRKDQESISSTMLRTLVLANKVDIPMAPQQQAGVAADLATEGKARAGAAILLARIAGNEPTITFELLVASLLSQQANLTLQKLNPYLKDDDIHSILDMTCSIVLHCSRLGHAHRTVSVARDLLGALLRLQEKQRKAQTKRARLQQQASTAGSESESSFDDEIASQNLTTFQSLYSQSQSLAQLLIMKRYFISAETSAVQGAATQNLLLAYDPRFLVFEFIHNILLRRSQVHLIHQFMKRVSEGKSMVNQMIMGMGKVSSLTQTHTCTHTDNTFHREPTHSLTPSHAQTTDLVCYSLLFFCSFSFRLLSSVLSSRCFWPIVSRW